MAIFIYLLESGYSAPVSLIASGSVLLLSLATAAWFAPFRTGVVVWCGLAVAAVVYCIAAAPM